MTQSALNVHLEKKKGLLTHFCKIHTINSTVIKYMLKCPILIEILRKEKKEFFCIHPSYNDSIKEVIDTRGFPSHKCNVIEEEKKDGKIRWYVYKHFQLENPDFSVSFYSIVSVSCKMINKRKLFSRKPLPREAVWIDKAGQGFMVV